MQCYCGLAYRIGSGQRSDGGQQAYAELVFGTEDQVFAPADETEVAEAGIEMVREIETHRFLVDRADALVIKKTLEVLLDGPLADDAPVPVPKPQNPSEDSACAQAKPETARPLTRPRNFLSGLNNVATLLNNKGPEFVNDFQQILGAILNLTQQFQQPAATTLPAGAFASSLGKAPSGLSG